MHKQHISRLKHVKINFFALFRIYPLTFQLKKECKKNIDKLGITMDNVEEISPYAYRSLLADRYDEVEAEYKALKERRH